MLKRISIVAALAACGLAVQAKAAIIVEVTPVAGAGTSTAFAGTAGATLGGATPKWTGYKVSLASDDGTNVTSANMIFGGPMHQRWGLVTDPDTGDVQLTPTPEETGSSRLTSVDSHFIIPAASRLIAPLGDPAETGSTLGSPIVSTATSQYGLGNSLTANLGFINGYAAPSVDVAYLVVRAGDRVTLSGAGTLSGGREFQFSGVVGAPVPEPAALTLMAASGAGLLIRRRRA